jgi:hypothetical protein
MKKITNREELNQYYKRVNELVDEYITGHNIRPSEVYHYFQRNLQSFLERTGLSDVDGIKKVVNDVLEHRRHMELDKVMKFESFNRLNESVLSIGNATVEHEKVLADYYNTSIGHIDLVDGDIHLYKINDFGKKVLSIIFSDSELQKVKENNGINVYFIRWDAYFVDLSNIPVVFERQKSEIDDIRWYNIKHLPAKTHFLIRYEIWFARIFNYFK